MSVEGVIRDRCAEVVSTGAADLLSALEYVAGREPIRIGYSTEVPELGLVLVSDRGALVAPMGAPPLFPVAEADTPRGIFNLAWSWLQKAEYPDYPDSEASVERGWRLFRGPIPCGYEGAELLVEPVWVLLRL